MNNACRSIAAMLLALAAPACRPGPDAAPPPLAGARIGGPFVLIDQNGKRFDSATLAGRYPLIYFGYTSCPDVCPTDMLAVGQGLKALEKSDPAKAAKVQPIFITVDPARDTPAVLKQFVSAFHPRLIGLTGSEAQIAAVAKDYVVMFDRQKPVAGATGYLVDHSRQTMLFGPDGKPIALVPSDAGGKAVAGALARWVE